MLSLLKFETSYLVPSLLPNATFINAFKSHTFHPKTNPHILITTTTMGINQCTKGKVLWKASGLSFQAIKSLDLGNRIDVDGNYLFYKLVGSGGKPVGIIIETMAAFLKQLAHNGGFVVNIIMDGSDRPDCKRASWERRKSQSLDEINRMYCRLKVLELSSQLENSETNEEQRSQIRRKLKEYNDAARKLENASGKAIITPDFCERLLARLAAMNAFESNENWGYVSKKIIKARFQADYVIARRILDKNTDFIFSTDSDFAAILGDACIMIYEIKDGKVGLCGVSNKKMNELKDYLDQLSPALYSKRDSI